MLVDINSLVDTTSEKGEVFKSNQTIRVLDQIASDVASVFNSKYLGKIANNEAGRTSLWSDIVTLFKDYQTLQAIENFEDDDISVEIGNDKKSVTINTSVQVINGLSKFKRPNIRESNLPNTAIRPITNAFNNIYFSLLIFQKKHCAMMLRLFPLDFHCISY